MRKTALFFLILLATVALFGQQSPRRPDKPNVFFEDTQIAAPAAISENVVSLLLETDAGKQGADFIAGLVANGRCEAQACNPASLFRAAVVHLVSPNERDLVVIGVCPMCGAGLGWFWVVRSAYTDPKVVLFAPGTSLELLESRTGGMRDVRSEWLGASQRSEAIYHFDGSNYKLWKETSAENAP
jgi:hypothetical protein